MRFITISLVMLMVGCSQSSQRPMAAMDVNGPVKTAPVMHSGVYQVLVTPKHSGPIKPVVYAKAFVKKGAALGFERDADGLYAIAGENRFFLGAITDEARAVAWYPRAARVATDQESGAQHRPAATAPPDLLDYPYDSDVRDQKHRAGVLDSIPN